MSTTADHVHPRVRLVALHDDPGSLAWWLGPDATAHTLVVRPDHRAPKLQIGWGLHTRARAAGPQLDVVDLPLDGPPTALGHATAAIAGLLGAAKERTAVVVQARPPPAPEVLAVVAAAGLIPGVDLTQGRWVARDRVWLAGPGGIAVIPRTGDDIELATVICRLGLLPSLHRSEDGIRHVARQEVPGTGAAWEDILRAGYVEAVVDRLLQLHHG